MKNNITFLVLIAILSGLSYEISIASETVNLNDVNIVENQKNQAHDTNSEKTPQERTADSNEKIANAVQKGVVGTVESISNIGRNFSVVGATIGSFINWLRPSPEQKERNELAKKRLRGYEIEVLLDKCLLQHKSDELDETTQMPIACKDLIDQFTFYLGNKECMKKSADFYLVRPK
ncbi:MAG: hypothetical protein ACOYT8_00550 [Candidatus Dependentiae bacterium]